MSEGRKVLVVSASAPERRRVVSALASRDAVEVIEVDRPFDARHRLAEGDIDVLVVDGDLAPMGGFSLLYELRADAEQHDRDGPPALVLTSRTEDIWLADWAGANGTLSKPVDPFEVAEVVGELAGTEPAPRDRSTGAESVREILAGGGAAGDHHGRGVGS